MPTEKEVSYKISGKDVSGPAVDSAIAGVKKFEAQTKTATEKMQEQWEKVKTNYTSLHFAATDAFAMIKKAWDMAKIGAEYEEQVGLLNGLSRKYNTTAADIVNSMRTASEGLIAKADLMQIALAGIAKGLNPEELTNLASAAHILGKVVGQDATTALSDLSQALESGRTKALKGYLGTNLDLTASFGDLAGKMTAVEKTHAMYLLVMTQATKLQHEQNEEVESAADKMDRMETRFKDVKLTVAEFSKALVVHTANFLSWLVTSQEVEQELRLAAEKKAKGYGNSNVATVNIKRPVEEDPALKEYERQIAALKKLLQSREDAKNAEKDAEKEARKAAHEMEERYREAQRLYDEDLRAFAAAQQGKIKLTNDTAKDQISNAQWSYDHGAQTYEDEAALIAAKRDATVSAAQSEQEAIVAQIECYGRSQSKQDEIAKLRTQWSEAYLREINAEKDAVLATADMEQRRFEKHIQSMAEINTQMNQLQRDMDMNTISKGFEGTSAGGPFMDLINAMSDESPYQKQIDLAKAAYDQELDAAEKFSDEKLRDLYKTTDREAIITQAGARKTAMIEKQQFAQRMQIASSAFGTMAGLAQAFYQASGEQSRAWFNLYKAFAIAEAIVSTISAAQKAYEAGMSIPGPHAPALAAAYAAMAIAAGVARVAQIASQEIGGSSSVGDTSSGGHHASASTYTASSDDTTTTTDTDTTTSTERYVNHTFQITVMGNIVDHDAFARELIGSLRKAEEDNA